MAPLHSVFLKSPQEAIWLHASRTLEAKIRRIIIRFNIKNSIKRIIICIDTKENHTILAD
jgi:hypothetical protein